MIGAGVAIGLPLQTMPTFTEFVDRMCEIAESIGRGFASPTDDWKTHLVVLGEEKQIHTYSVDALMASDQTKEAYWQQIGPRLLRRERAVMFVQVGSAWAARGQRDQPSPPPSERPDRFEILIIVGGHRDGSREMRTAAIHRHPDQPPTLGAWRNDGQMSGRMIDPLLAALNPEGATP